jgi:UDP-2,4-diacetamido-2,4,6-trideoxy-beta-L-altropyranose hydrolase
MKVAIRVDASPTIGIGHLGRCLALAEALRALGASIVFVTRDLRADTVARVERHGFAATLLPAPATSWRPSAADEPSHAAWAGVSQMQDVVETSSALADFRPDWVIVDHYAFDERWHRELAAGCSVRICVVDDLADRPVDAELLVDHNPSADHRIKYAGKGRLERLLGGPRYALLGRAYATATRYAFSPVVDSIGIFMGGTDAHQTSALALRACREVARFTGPIEVATTAANPHLDALSRLCTQARPTELLVDSPDLTAFFARHDLQIGGGGVAAWERCCIGAPALTLKWADNHAIVLDALEAQGAARSAALTLESIGHTAAELIADAAGRRLLSERSRGWIDGKGAERVAIAMYADAVSLRPATMEDAAAAHVWRNDERTRTYSRQPASVPLGEHMEWWARTLRDPKRRLLVASCGQRAIGSVRFDLDRDSAEVSLYLDPELTGLGLGLALLRAAQGWIAALGTTEVRAEVLPGNVASVATFRAAGFASDDARHWTWTTTQHLARSRRTSGRTPSGAS